MIDLCSIRKIQTALKRFEDGLKAETGLSLNDALCLCSISKGIQEPGLLARELELSPSRLTRILDALEGRKLIVRELSNTDRRSLSVLLTKSGEKMVNTYKCSGIEIPEDLAFTQN
jgi:DNA-binding MarR family transcriptional regulator